LLSFVVEAVSEIQSDTLTLSSTTHKRPTEWSNSGNC